MGQARAEFGRIQEEDFSYQPYFTSSPAVVVVQAFRLAVTVVVQAFRLAAGLDTCSSHIMITKRPRRIDGFPYVGYQRYFLTTCTAFRRPLFTNAALASSIVAQLMHNRRAF